MQYVINQSKLYNVKNLHRVERLIPLPLARITCLNFLSYSLCLSLSLSIHCRRAPPLAKLSQSISLSRVRSLSLSISLHLYQSNYLCHARAAQWIHSNKTIIKMKMKSNKTMKMKKNNNNSRNQNSNNNMKYMYEQHDQQHPHPSAGKLSLYLQVEIVVYTTYIYIVLVEIVKSFTSGCVCGLSPKSPSHLIANVSSYSSFSMFGILDPP